MAQARQYSLVGAAFALLVAVVTPVRAAEHDALRAFASKHAGAQIDEDARKVTWAQGEDAITAGWFDGDRPRWVRITRPRSQPTSQASAQQTAIGLASAHFGTKPDPAWRWKQSRQSCWHIQIDGPCTRFDAVIPGDGGWCSGWHIEHGFDAGQEHIVILDRGNE